MEKWVVKRYVYMLEPSDRVELNDDDVGSSDDRALDCLADREFLAAALLCLKPREERLIRLRYGIGGIGVRPCQDGQGAAAVYSTSLSAQSGPRANCKETFANSLRS